MYVAHVNVYSLNVARSSQKVWYPCRRVLLYFYYYNRVGLEKK